MLVHLSLVASVLVTHFLGLLLSTALPKRGALPRAAKNRSDDNANNQCGNRCQNQVCHMLSRPVALKMSKSITGSITPVASSAHALILRQSSYCPANLQHGEKNVYTR